VVNYFEGFLSFLEEKTDFLHLMKHQTPVTLKSFENMPLLIPAGYTIGKTKLSFPMNFSVKSVNDNSVTLVSVSPKTVPDSEWDVDGESDRTDNNLPETMEFTISKEEFAKLLTPQNPPAAPSL
jgi:hypothetical protein